MKELPNGTYGMRIEHRSFDIKEITYHPPQRGPLSVANPDNKPTVLKRLEGIRVRCTPTLYTLAPFEVTVLPMWWLMPITDKRVRTSVGKFMVDREQAGGLVSLLHGGVRHTIPLRRFEWLVIPGRSHPALARRP